MIICFLLQHYLYLTKLPPAKQEMYIQSRTNTCKVYSERTWKIVDKDGNKVVVSNGVIESSGYYYIRKQNKRREK